MSAHTRGRREGARAQRRSDLALTMTLWAALVATLVPLVRVLSLGPWFSGAVLFAGALLMLGWTLRRLRVPAVAVTAAEALFWVGAITALAFPGAGLLAVIPTGAVFAEIPAMAQRIGEEVYIGVPPLVPGRELSMAIIAAMGLVTVLLDHVVLTARMPLLAAAVIVAVWLVPTLAVPASFDAVGFVLLAIAIIALLRTETRTRWRGYGPAPGTSLVVAVAATVAIFLALVVTPSLPAGRSAAGGGTTRVEATLDLGADLREQSEAVVLTVSSTAARPPYLRMATLSRFDGDLWAPDRVRSAPLDLEGALPAVTTEPGIALAENTTRVRVTALSSAYLPVPFPAVAVTGLEGSWRAVPYSRTVLSTQNGAQGQKYEVRTEAPRPTLEQIREARATSDTSQQGLTELPEDMPASIAETAREVTAEATTDYDRLVALQDWLRGPAFTYSLTAPVGGGFDGSSADAVAAFLEVREGYCVHFAGAFALMARSLGMPTRVVVGFLPGEATDDKEGDAPVFAVRASQLHAWPEVYFPEVGWVEFEPTKSLGTPTRFTSDADGDGEEPAEPTPTTSAPAPAPTATSAPDRDPGDAGGGVGGGSGFPVLPVVLWVGALLAVGAAPGLIGLLRRRALLRRTREADPAGRAAAWRFVQDAALDVGARLPASESVRELSARLVEAYGAPAKEMARLADAVERVSYARAAGDADTLAVDAVAVRAAMLAAAASSARTRLGPLLAPRSLLARPEARPEPTKKS